MVWVIIGGHGGVGHQSACILEGDANGGSGWGGAGAGEVDGAAVVEDGVGGIGAGACIDGVVPVCDVRSSIRIFGIGGDIELMRCGVVGETTDGGVFGVGTGDGGEGGVVRSS